MGAIEIIIIIIIIINATQTRTFNIEAKQCNGDCSYECI